ncbi:MAG: WD40 repeat domain-containing protein [Chloroflexi bacterium]|nr:WD40 repeat domain-containing protein [Chloroflexota bacterium]
MAKNSCRTAIEPARTRALAEVKQFETGLLAEVAAEKELVPAITSRPPGFVNDLVFCPDGGSILAAQGPYIRRWDLATGKCLQVLEGHENTVDAMCLTADGNTLVSAAQDHTLRVWDVSSGKNVHVYQHQYPKSLALMPGEEQVVVGEYKWISLVDVTTGKHGQAWSARQNNFVHSIALSPDGQVAVTAAFEGRRLSVIDMRTGRRMYDLEGHQGQVKSVAISPDGITLASGAWDDTVRLWHLPTGSPRMALNGHSDYVQRVIFTPDGKTLLSAARDGRICVWDVKSGSLLHVLAGHQSAVLSLAISPDGRRLASGGWDQDVYIWDLRDRQVLQSLRGYSRQVHSVAFHPGGKVMVAGSWGPTCRSDDHALRLLNDLSTGQCNLVVQEAHAIGPLAIHPDGDMVAVGNRDAIMLWNAKTGRHLLDLSGHWRRVLALAFSPDGRTLISGGGSEHDNLCIWNAQTWECMLVSSLPHTIHALSVCPDGESFLSAEAAHVSLYDIHTAHQIQQLDLEPGAPASISAMAIDPGGKTFVTGGDRDAQIYQWDLGSGKRLRTFAGHHDPVRSLALSPDGKVLVSGSRDGTLIFWDYESGELLATAYNVETGYLWLTPADAGAPHGWLWTNRPDLISMAALSKANPEVPEFVAEGEARFKEYMRLYNDRDMVMKRIFARPRYTELLRLRAGQMTRMQTQSMTAGDQVQPHYLPQPRP